MKINGVEYIQHHNYHPLRGAIRDPLRGAIQGGMKMIAYDNPNNQLVLNMYDNTGIISKVPLKTIDKDLLYETIYNNTILGQPLDEEDVFLITHKADIEKKKVESSSGKVHQFLKENENLYNPQEFGNMIELLNKKGERKVNKKIQSLQQEQSLAPVIPKKTTKPKKPDSDLMGAVSVGEFRKEVSKPKKEKEVTKAKLFKKSIKGIEEITDLDLVIDMAPDLLQEIIKPINEEDKKELVSLILQRVGSDKDLITVTDIEKYKPIFINLGKSIYGVQKADQINPFKETRIGFLKDVTPSKKLEKIKQDFEIVKQNNNMLIPKPIIKEFKEYKEVFGYLNKLDTEGDELSKEIIDEKIQALDEDYQGMTSKEIKEYINKAIKSDKKFMDLFNEKYKNKTPEEKEEILKTKYSYLNKSGKKFEYLICIYNELLNKIGIETTNKKNDFDLTDHILGDTNYTESDKFFTDVVSLKYSQFIEAKAYQEQSWCEFKRGIMINNYMYNIMLYELRTKITEELKNKDTTTINKFLQDGNISEDLLKRYFYANYYYEGVPITINKFNQYNNNTELINEINSMNDIDANSPESRNIVFNEQKRKVIATFDEERKVKNLEYILKQKGKDNKNNTIIKDKFFKNPNQRFSFGIMVSGGDAFGYYDYTNDELLDGTDITRVYQFDKIHQSGEWKAIKIPFDKFSTFMI